MTRDEVLTAVHTVLRDHMQHPHLAAFAPQARLNEDLYLDSVLMLNLFLNLEMEFGLAAPDEAIAGDEIATVDDLAALFLPGGAAEPTVIPQPVAPSLGVHGEDYVDLKIHCFVSCVCAALKKAPVIDHRPFYFGVWDADFAIGENWTLLYHAPSISHDGFRHWYHRLYGVEVREWYDRSKPKEANLAVLLDLLERRTPDQYIMVMLDMYHLPERENKFNQNPFPHYLMLETTEDPEIWQVLDPDFRWEGLLEKERVLNAVRQPTVAGGYVFDRAEAHAPRPEDLRDYFQACFHPDENPLTDGVRAILRAHVEGTDGVGLSGLGHALRELPVISIRKYAYEHGFAFFWRALGLPDEEFQAWCDEIDTLAQSFKAFHYAALKLSQTGDLALVEAMYESLDRLDALEFKIKNRLSQVFGTWCVRHGLSSESRAQPRRAVG